MSYYNNCIYCIYYIYYTISVALFCITSYCVLLLSHFPSLEVSMLPPCFALCGCPSSPWDSWRGKWGSHSPLSCLSCSAMDFNKHLKLEVGILASGEPGNGSDKKLSLGNLLFALAETLMLEESGVGRYSWVHSFSHLRTDTCSYLRQGDLCHSMFTPVNQHGADL